MKFKGTMNDEEILGKIVQLMQTDDSKDAPTDAIRWSKNLFRTRAAAEPEKSIVRRVLAVLQMDLSPGKPAFGERSGATSAARQMLFSAGENQIDLRIAKMNRKFSVSGQVFGEGFAGAEIGLFNDEKSLSVKSNELSEFKFENVSKATYNLSLIVQDKEIIIENIEIG